MIYCLVFSIPPQNFQKALKIRPGPQGRFVLPSEGGCLTGVFESLIICTLWNWVVNLMAKWHWASTRGVSSGPNSHLWRFHRKNWSVYHCYHANIFRNAHWFDMKLERHTNIKWNLTNLAFFFENYISGGAPCQKRPWGKRPWASAIFCNFLNKQINKPTNDSVRCILSRFEIDNWF